MERAACTRHEYVARLEFRFWGQHHPRRKCFDFFGHKLVAPNGAHLEDGALSCRRQAVLGSGTLARFNRQQEVARSDPVGYLTFELAYQYFPRLAGSSEDRGCAEAHLVDRYHEVGDAPLLLESWERQHDVQKSFGVNTLAAPPHPRFSLAHARPHLGPGAQKPQVLRRREGRLDCEGGELLTHEQPVELFADDGESALPGEQLAVDELSAVKPVVGRVARLGSGDHRPLEQSPPVAKDSRGRVLHVALERYRIGDEREDITQWAVRHSRPASGARQGAPPPRGGRPARPRAAQARRPPLWPRRQHPPRTG